jgi:hypothetical protein
VGALPAARQPGRHRGRLGRHGDLAGAGDGLACEGLLVARPVGTHRSSAVEARFFSNFLVIFSGDESELYDGDIFLMMNRVV